MAVRSAVLGVWGGIHFPIYKHRKDLDFSWRGRYWQSWCQRVVLYSASGNKVLKDRVLGPVDKRTDVSYRYSSLLALILSLELNLCCSVLSWNAVGPQIPAQGKLSIILASCVNGQLPSLWIGMHSKSKLSIRKHQPQIISKLEFRSW